ncbi:hypothetical protein SCP_1403390 [Sparassis crispa]|uniref:Uncharacterized protein n=1 Tax=Sparassis crispa TaxID=139825 RepID=A0A401H3E5_9APHY|nr:hypothetical protein SCP_1403390 [Sparassis crispa]GBE88931.1 hypothetical protein SCP_1403390 [Sparassis crispa]
MPPLLATPPPPESPPVFGRLTSPDLHPHTDTVLSTPVLRSASLPKGNVPPAGRLLPTVGLPDERPSRSEGKEERKMATSVSGLAAENGPPAERLEDLSLRLAASKAATDNGASRSQSPSSPLTRRFLQDRSPVTGRSQVTDEGAKPASVGITSPPSAQMLAVRQVPSVQVQPGIPSAPVDVHPRFDALMEADPCKAPVLSVIKLRNYTASVDGPPRLNTQLQVSQSEAPPVSYVPMQADHPTSFGLRPEISIQPPPLLVPPVRNQVNYSPSVDTLPWTNTQIPIPLLSTAFTFNMGPNPFTPHSWAYGAVPAPSPPHTVGRTNHNSRGPYRPLVLSSILRSRRRLPLSLHSHRRTSGPTEQSAPEARRLMVVTQHVRREVRREAARSIPRYSERRIERLSAVVSEGWWRNGRAVVLHGMPLAVQRALGWTELDHGGRLPMRARRISQDVEMSSAEVSPAMPVRGLNNADEDVIMDSREAASIPSAATLRPPLNIVAAKNTQDAAKNTQDIARNTQDKYTQNIAKETQDITMKEQDTETLAIPRALRDKVTDAVKDFPNVVMHSSKSQQDVKATEPVSTTAQQGHPVSSASLGNAIRIMVQGSGQFHGAEVCYYDTYIMDYADQDGAFWRAHFQEDEDQALYVEKIEAIEWSQVGNPPDEETVEEEESDQQDQAGGDEHMDMAEAQKDVNRRKGNDDGLPESNRRTEPMAQDFSTVVANLLSARNDASTEILTKTPATAARGMYDGSYIASTSENKKYPGQVKAAMEDEDGTGCWRHEDVYDVHEFRAGEWVKEGKPNNEGGHGDPPTKIDKGKAVDRGNMVESSTRFNDKSASNDSSSSSRSHYSQVGAGMAVHGQFPDASPAHQNDDSTPSETSPAAPTTELPAENDRARLVAMLPATTEPEIVDMLLEMLRSTPENGVPATEPSVPDSAHLPSVPPLPPMEKSLSLLPTSSAAAETRCTRESPAVPTVTPPVDMHVRSEFPTVLPTTTPTNYNAKASMPPTEELHRQRSNGEVRRCEPGPEDQGRVPFSPPLPPAWRLSPGFDKSSLRRTAPIPMATVDSPWRRSRGMRVAGGIRLGKRTQPGDTEVPAPRHSPLVRLAYLGPAPIRTTVSQLSVADSSSSEDDDDAQTGTYSSSDVVGSSDAELHIQPGSSPTAPEESANRHGLRAIAGIADVALRGVRRVTGWWGS